MNLYKKSPWRNFSPVTPRSDTVPWSNGRALVFETRFYAGSSPAGITNCMVMGREYHRPYARNWYHQRRAEYTKELGGKCVGCGETEKLQFDHINWRTKSFPIAKLMCVSQEKAREELKKCQLLCHSCHVIKNRSDRAERKLELGRENREGVPALP
jgi:hypothetical protein